MFSLSWELERQGLPTVTLCAGQCMHLATTMISVVMPGLSLSQLSIQRHSAPADIAAETGWVMGEIVDGLTTAPEQLCKLLQQKFLTGSLKVKVNNAGELHLWSPQLFMLSEELPRRCLSILLTMP